MDLIYILLAFIVVSLISYKYFSLSIGLLILFLPTYLLRFSFFNYPTTLLEVVFGSVFLMWLIKYAKKDFTELRKSIKELKIFYIFILLFLISSVISIFTSGEVKDAFGLWRAYFLQPLILFIMIISSIQRIKRKRLMLYLCLSVLSIVIYSIFQSFTGIGIATPQWSAAATRRVTAFFSSPNAIGLYITPITFLMLYFVFLMKKQGIKNTFVYNKYLWVVILILSCIALFFTKSQGAWVGLFTGILTLLFLLNYKKISTVIFVCAMLLAILIPSIRSALFFQDLASKNRLLLWNQSWSYLTDNPKNFVFGTGIRQFYNKIQKPNHDWKRIERHIYPHNIFLNFWTEIGLLGMVSFVGILAYLFLLSFRLKETNMISGPFLFSALTALLIHGLVDVPYFKNDLAFLFWILSALVIVSIPLKAKNYEI